MATRRILSYAPKRPQPLRIEVVPFHGRPPGGGAHGHRFFELLYIAAGSGTHRVGANDYHVQSGDLFPIAPGQLHDGSHLQASGSLVLFTTDALVPGASDTDLWARPGDPAFAPFLAPRAHLQLPPERRPRWEQRIAELAGELLGQSFGWVEAARAHLRLLLVEAARLSGVSPAAHPILGAVFGFIEARYAQPISLEDVARAVGRSPAYLTSLVKRETGRPVLAWIVERRLAEARRLLATTDETVATIAERVSYSDASWFIRQFQKAHGLTPRAWRERVRRPTRDDK